MIRPLEKTNDHFKSDPIAGGYKLAEQREQQQPRSRAEKKERGDQDREKKHRNRERLGQGDGEEDEIRKAIELSKVTAMKEEEERI